MKPAMLRRFAPARRQRGVVLFVALIVLIVMSLAGVALLRQMGAGTSIAGNVAFKENATSVADRGTEWARQWIQVNSAVTGTDSTANGYYSSWGTKTDPTTFLWDTESKQLLDDQNQTGNRARIIIHRLCAVANLAANAPGQTCSDYPQTNAGNSTGGGGYPSVLPGSTPAPFYRVTTRVDGPRNTVSYTQVIMH